jgi:CPA1 family monovalent cation:H+ antiporter
VADGRPFPDRDLILFLTFSVILVTLVGQGLLLPWVIRALASSRPAATSSIRLVPRILRATTRDRSGARKA